MIVAAFIFVLACLGFLQFFVSYCRSLIAAYNTEELSPQARELTGIQDRAGVRGEEFGSLLQLVQMCPELGDDGSAIRAVKAYYGLVGMLRSLVPGVRAWVELERSQCAYFAAVVLDRRIARNRDLYAQQTSGSL